MNDNTKYLNRIKFLLSFGHPQTIRDIATLTLSSELSVIEAINQLREDGINVWTDGIEAEIRGRNE